MSMKLSSEIFDELNQLIKLAVNNQINEASLKCAEKAQFSIYHSYGLSFINLLDMISLDVDKVCFLIVINFLITICLRIN